MKTTIKSLVAGTITALCCSLGNAQIIYSNYFDPSASAATIHGVAPTFASTNVLLGGLSTAVWTVTLSNSYAGSTMTGFTNSTLLQNGTPGTNRGCALLPFVPQSGHVYDMNASLTVPTNQQNWVAMGFTTTNNNNPTAITNIGTQRFTDNPPGGYAWMYVQSKTPPALASAPAYLGRGTGSSLGTAINFVGTNSTSSNGTYTLDIVLSTLNSKWSVAAYVNGLQDGVLSNYSANPTIGYAGVGQTDLSAGLGPTNIHWNYWSLSAALRPFITTQPKSQTVVQSGSYSNTLGVTADANGGALAYQWYTNGVPLVNGGAISGATGSVLNINPVSTNYAGTTNFYVVVTNNYGSATSSLVGVTVLLNPAITAQFPVPYTNPMTLFGGTNILGTKYLGSTPTFSISVVGAPPFGYQWFTNGVGFAGATNASFTFTNCQWNSPTNFTCIVTNIYGAATNTWTTAYAAAPPAPFPQAVLADQPVGFWRLNESAGVLCNDYQSGNNGIYTNVAFAGPGSGYNNSGEPAETSVQFSPSGAYNSYAGQIQNLDFAAPSGSNAEFTVGAWANSFGVVNGPVLIQGTYGASEAFNLGVDTNSVSGPFYQFYIRTAGGTVYKAVSSQLAGDLTWHYLMGVCDEANSNVSLYIDGALAVSTNTAALAHAGLYEAAAPLSIGGQYKAAAPYPQFNGYADDVSAYRYALSPLKVATLYIAASGSLAPAFAQTPPNNVTVNAGATLVIPASLIGSPTMSYTWTDLNTSTVLATGSSDGDLLDATLTIPNVSGNLNSHQLQLTVNGAGSATANVTLTVNFGAPQIATDVAPMFGAPLGGTASDSITVTGTQPMTYQWQLTNGYNLTDNGRITGSQSSALSIANVQAGDRGGYQVVITNLYGAVTSSVATLIIENYLPIGFNVTGLGWTPNGGPTAVTNNQLTLTEGGPSEARAFFFNSPQYISAFQASFTYSSASNGVANGVANGATFCIQNDPRGASALGGTGYRLGVGANAGVGVAAIAPSCDLVFNIYPGYGVGYALVTDGNVISATPPFYLPTGSTPAQTNMLPSGDPINVTLNYAGGVMSLVLTDAVAGVSFSTNLDIGDLASLVGGTNTAYVGFTASTGGAGAVQTITNFAFVSIPTAAIEVTGTNALISWPGAIVGYTLQENGDLTTTNWLSVTNQSTLTNNLFEATVPISNGNLFYRLVGP